MGGLKKSHAAKARINVWRRSAPVLGRSNPRTNLSQDIFKRSAYPSRCGRGRPLSARCFINTRHCNLLRRILSSSLAKTSGLNSTCLIPHAKVAKSAKGKTLRRCGLRALCVRRTAVRLEGSARRTPRRDFGRIIEAVSLIRGGFFFVLCGGGVRAYLWPHETCG